MKQGTVLSIITGALLCVIPSLVITAVLYLHYLSLYAFGSTAFHIAILAVLGVWLAALTGLFAVLVLCLLLALTKLR